MFDELLLNGFLTLWLRTCDSQGNHCTLPQKITASTAASGILISPQEINEFSEIEFKTSNENFSGKMKIIWLKRENNSESLIARVRLYSNKKILGECTNYYSKNQITLFPEGSCSAIIEGSQEDSIQQFGLTYSRQSY